MPPKSKVPKGELTSAEIRKLIRAHNTIVKKNLLIKIPAGTTREGLIKLVSDKGFTIRHAAKKIESLFDSPPYDFISLDDVDDILKKPTKTALEKQKATESKAAKAEMKKKEVRAIKKQAIKEEKARSKPKAKPKAKTASIAVGTEEPKPKPKPKAEPKKKEEPKKSNEKEVRDLWKRVLIPELKTTFESGDKEKMKKAYTKAVGILAKYESKVRNVSEATARKKIKGMGGAGRFIRNYGEGKKTNSATYQGIDITDLLN
jgi:hypothetical protein